MSDANRYHYPMTNNLNLLPCPFCGSYAEIEDLGLARYKSICCQNPECPASPTTLGHLDDQENVDHWNQRNKSVAESQDGCLPCPFCGDYPDVACDGDDPPAHYIQCLACYVSTYAYGDTKDEALSKWNTRVWTSVEVLK